MKRICFIISGFLAFGAVANEAITTDSVKIDTVQVIEGAHRLVLTENAQALR